jgi:hypothetical protein
MYAARNRASIKIGGVMPSSTACVSGILNSPAQRRQRHSQIFLDRFSYSELAPDPHSGNFTVELCLI